MLSEQGLDDAIALLKAGFRAETLSDAARSTIFDAARRPLGKFEALAFLFPQTRILATAVAIPLVLTLALLFSLPS